MTTMTPSELEQHIQSNSWEYVNSKRIGSQDYNSHIGVLRIMFGLTEDPTEITTLLSDDKTEVWVRFDNDWELIF